MESTPLRRTQIYLPVEQHAALAEVARDRRSTNSALIRQAIGDFLAKSQPVDQSKKRLATAGQWSNNTDFNFVALRKEERSF